MGVATIGHREAMPPKLSYVCMVWAKFLYLGSHVNLDIGTALNRIHVSIHSSSALIRDPLACILLANTSLVPRPIPHFQRTWEKSGTG